MFVTTADYFLILSAFVCFLWSGLFHLILNPLRCLTQISLEKLGNVERSPLWSKLPSLSTKKTFEDNVTAFVLELGCLIVKVAPLWDKGQVVTVINFRVVNLSPLSVVLLVLPNSDSCVTANNWPFTTLHSTIFKLQ